MISLYDNSLNMNNNGIEIKKILKEEINNIFQNSYVNGYNPIHISNILNDLVVEYKDIFVDKTKRYFKDYNPYNDTNDRLKIKNIETNEIKESIFLGYSNHGNSMWEYEEGWIPTLPCGIKTSVDNKKFWYKLKTIEDE